MPSDDTNALHLISDILDKLIDSQEGNAKANTGFKESIDDLNDTLKDLNSHFTNGFRSEIKEHITSKNDPLAKSVESIEKKIDKLTSTLEKPSFWIKLVATIVGSLAIIIIATMKLFEVMGT